MVPTRSPNHAPIIEIKHLKNYLGGQWVHTDVNCSVYPGEIFCIVGPSGAGKTTLLRSLLKLQEPTAGEVRVLDIDVLNSEEAAINRLRRSWGVLFQQSALFSSMTLLDNVKFPLNEFTHFNHAIKNELALLKISMVGLPVTSACLMPGELSGGMKKRAGLARAIALDPKILILDEPTSGLDPQGAEDLDDLILYLRNNLGLTVVVVTHDLDSLWHISDKVCFLAEGKTLATLPMAQLVEHEDPIIQAYFGGPRGQLRRR